jgi:hypothetical protein
MLSEIYITSHEGAGAFVVLAAAFVLSYVIRRIGLLSDPKDQQSFVHGLAIAAGLFTAFGVTDNAGGFVGIVGRVVCGGMAYFGTGILGLVLFVPGFERAERDIAKKASQEKSEGK